MNVLLDTHTFIWLDSAPEKLSKTALELCQNKNNTLKNIEINFHFKMLVGQHCPTNGDVMLIFNLENVISVVVSISSLSPLKVGALTLNYFKLLLDP